MCETNARSSYLGSPSLSACAEAGAAAAAAGAAAAAAAGSSLPSSSGWLKVQVGSQFDSSG